MKGARPKVEVTRSESMLYWVRSRATGVEN